MADSRWLMAGDGWIIGHATGMKGGGMPFRFESLEIWNKARAYAAKIYSVTAKFPRHEDYGLRSQMNGRSTRLASTFQKAPPKALTRLLTITWKLPSVPPSRWSAHLSWL